MASRILTSGIPFLLAGLMLVQVNTFSIIQLDFSWNRDTIAALFCVNLDKPEMNCKGSCELDKRLKKAADTEQPQTTGLSEIISLVYVFSTPFSLKIPFSPGVDGQIASCFLEPGNCRFSSEGIFHPPQS